MVATLTFNLEDHSERESHMRCVKALDLALALYNIHGLKSKIENFIDFKKPKNNHELLEYIFNLINDEIDCNNINFEEILS